MRRKYISLIIFVLILAVPLVYASSYGSSEPEFTAFSTEPGGASLLFDTLRAMGFPVEPGYAPIGNQTSGNEVYIILRPTDPVIDADQAAEILSWVRRGGRLIYLDDVYPNIIDKALLTSESVDLGSLTLYRYGMGEVVSGEVYNFTNESLLYNSEPGTMVQLFLEKWSPDKVYFAEYYHGYRQNENFFARLPLAVKIIVYQIILCVAALLWYGGKRFGKPIPFYEETEREENEAVYALARLYEKMGVM